MGADIEVDTGDFPHRIEDCPGEPRLKNPQIQDETIIYMASCPKCGKSCWGIASVNFEGFTNRI